MKKVNTIKLINELIQGNLNFKDCSLNGKCSKCGECCTNFLPICQEELNIIQKYVIENDIKPQTNLLVMEQKLTCPYFNGHKCLIYEVRPLICKEFYCYKKPTMETGMKFREKEYIPVNMWAIAKDIEKQRKGLKIND